MPAFVFVLVLGSLVKTRIKDAYVVVFKPAPPVNGVLWSLTCPTWFIFRSSFFGSTVAIDTAVEEKEGMGSSHNLQVEVPDVRRTVSDNTAFIKLGRCTGNIPEKYM